MYITNPGIWHPFSPYLCRAYGPQFDELVRDGLRRRNKESLRMRGREHAHDVVAAEPISALQFIFVHLQSICSVIKILNMCF